MKRINYIIILLVFGLLTNYSNARENIIKTSQKSAVTVTAGCLPASSETNLNLNNVRALILANGGLWQGDSAGEYEIPSGSGKTSMYAGSIWVGGVDVNGQLRTCARTFRQASYGNDYWPGPLISSGEGIASVSAEVCELYDSHFKITKDEVEEFIEYYEADAETKAESFSDYTVPKIIQEWPAHGPTDYGAYDFYLAPFQDVDGDGVYNYSNGDYPYYEFDTDAPCNYQPERSAENLGNTSQKLFGDMTIWWVYNDKGNVHTTTVGAASIGMEFRAQAFAFSTNDDLNNMTFYNYQIINRSTYSLTDAYFGVWNDPDLGYAYDDAAGCDVVRGLGYVYNAEDIDGSGETNAYGENPPAIGVDFFEGPYQDADGSDNPTSWMDAERTTLDCENGYVLNDEGTGDNVATGEPGDIFNGNINGLNFGDGVVDNERWGMRRFVFYVSGGNNNGDPSTALHFYQYLKGYWLDGSRMTYGGNGDGGTEVADFMYPDDTDVCGWGTNGIPQDSWTIEDDATATDGLDFRIVQSAGPFVLEPGAVNDITVGVVWARSSSTAWASVEEVRKADIKAQRLFENCFQLIDGPSAPEMDIVELDGKLIFHLWNKTESNNYLESYSEKDPFIDQTLDEDEKYYTFQGYQVFQLADETVTVAEITDDSKARQVFQCDIKDGVSQIVNYVWDSDLSANNPVERVDGLDEGISHSFEITEDAFGSGDSKSLVNYQEYIYVAIAYAHNDYDHYDAVNEGTLGNQTTPYLAGRKNIYTQTVIPHSIDALNEGTKLNSDYGDVPAITLVEGKGTGDNVLELSDETIDDILAKTSYPFKSDKVIYKENGGPVNVKVIDPINIIDANFTLRLIKDSVNIEGGNYNSSDLTSFYAETGLIYDSKWELSYEYEGEMHYYYSDSWIRFADEKLIPELGISITIEQTDFPGQGVMQKFDEKDNTNNGFQEAEISYEKDLTPWLDFVADVDGQTPFNWIRTGSQTKAEDDEIDYSDWLVVDPEQVYEKILSATWAPYAFTAKITYGPANVRSKPTSMRFDKYRLPSVNIVITKDQDLWTRCPVVEMAENDDGNTENSLSDGGALRFRMREAPSKNKEGVSADTTLGDNLTDIDSPNYIGATGMSWFPGYAIDVETGERLNIMFGEDSWLVGENGNDMLWNPTAKYGDDLFVATSGASGTPYFGGKHYLYIVGHNESSDVVNLSGVQYSQTMPSYDEGRTLYGVFKDLRPNSTTTDNIKNIQEELLWKHTAWTAIPIVNEGSEFWDYESMTDNTITIKLRVSNPYCAVVGDAALENPENDNFPMFEFSTTGLRSEKGNTEGYGSSALDKINIVPNPYYGASEYELTQLDNYVKIINLPERCIVSIYTPNGGLIRRFDKDNTNSYVTWDLNNQDGISIASGMYIIHINAPELGEKVIKWFGSLRPVDLNAF
jgi:hypothetical protein